MNKKHIIKKMTSNKKLNLYLLILYYSKYIYISIKICSIKFNFNEYIAKLIRLATYF